MRDVSLVFLHGWGFDAAMWDGVRALLGDWPGVAIDRGYFGAPVTPSSGAPVVAIGHSLGALLLLLSPPAGLRALIAINGFDRFAGDGAVPPRVVDRMIARFAVAPREVLAAFRERCGEEAAFGDIDGGRLAADLALLRSADARAADVAVPMLAVDGGADPILPAGQRAASFGHARALSRETREDGGHLLPLTDPAWCAGRIGAWLDVLP